jgi:tetratricopeptide (TPR) repeat protein
MKVSRIKLVGVALVIFAVAVWLYWPSVHGEFLDVDDKDYVQQAASWNGLTWTAVTRAFTITQPYYHPLPRLSHVLDYQVWGKNAAGHHATSVILHALNAALVFGFVWTLLGAVSLAAAERFAVAVGVATVFGIHPLQVESVAWIAGRTQLLCLTFGIGCLWVYITGGPCWAVWGLFTLALLCKPTAVSLPFAMLALDYFPLRRYERFGWGRLVWEKAPMMALAVVAGAITVATETSLAPWNIATPADRVLMTFQSLVFYPYRLVCPWHISPFYPLRLRPSLVEWKVVVSVLSVGLITTVAVWSRRRLPALAAAWAAYIVFVLPVSGLTQGLGAVAPRHAYVGMLPLLLLAGGAAVWVWRRSTSAAHLAITGLLVGELCVSAACTRNLIPEWHSEETLRRAVLAWFPYSEFDNRMLALVLLEQGKVGQALEYAERAVHVAPEQSYAHMTLGNVLGRLGRPQEAMAQHEQAFRMNPDSALANYNFGEALMEFGKVPEAVEHYEQALRIKPNFAGAQLKLGVALEKLGRHDDAIRHYQEASRIAPDYAEAHESLGNALMQVGRLPEATVQYELALRINPDYAEAHNNLGACVARTGKIAEAIAHYEQALRINPDYAEAHNNLGACVARTGKIAEAIAHFEQALRINPDVADAHYNLGITLAQTGKIAEAIAHYEQALRINPDLAGAHYSLAIDLEKTGRLPEAVEHYQQALKLRPDFAPARDALARLQAGR